MLLLGNNAKNFNEKVSFFILFSEGNYFTELFGVILTGVYIDIVGIDVNMK